MARRELGPHALAITRAVRGALEQVDGPLVVGCSGGPDSLALAAAVAHLGRPARALVIDHQLQEGSQEVALRARAQLEPRGLPVNIVTVRVDESGSGPEAEAREARHEAFDLATDPGTVLLLGHTLDDQAEQVLLGLARGSGTRSLAGIPPVRDLPGGGVLLRPLLGIRRASTRAACVEWGLEPWDDPHNADPSFARVRVRSRVLPLLEAELGPGISEALARTADLARADADHLDDLAAVDPLPAELPVELLQQPAAIATRILRNWLVARGATEPGMAHVHAVLRLVTHWHGQGPIQVPGLQVARRGAVLQVVPD